MMEWEDKAGFNAAPVEPWKVQGDRGTEAAGTVQSFHGLTFLRIFDAGHMVPL